MKLPKGSTVNQEDLKIEKKKKTKLRFSHLYTDFGE